MIIIIMNILLILLRLLDGSSKYVPHSARLLDTLAYARRAPVIFFRVRPSTCLHNQLGSHAADFREIRYLRLLSKFVYKNPNSVYIGQRCRTQT